MKIVYLSLLIEGIPPGIPHSTEKDDEESDIGRCVSEQATLMWKVIRGRAVERGVHWNPVH